MYQSIQKFKTQMNRTEGKEPVPGNAKKSIANDPRLHELICTYLRSNGIYGTTLSKLKAFVREKRPDTAPPSSCTMAKVLKQVFHLRYAKTIPANVKYRDPTYNEKRLWVSRIMAQLLYGTAVITCIDESNFKSGGLHGKQWEFKPMLKAPKDYEPASLSRKSAVRPLVEKVTTNIMLGLNERLKQSDEEERSASLAHAPKKRLQALRSQHLSNPK